jgi:predicted DNA binding CopG/RHH family protein
MKPAKAAEKQYVRDDKLTRPAGIGLPGDLLNWVADTARHEGIPKSRFVTQVLETERKRRRRRTALA